MRGARLKGRDVNPASRNILGHRQSDRMIRLCRHYINGTDGVSVHRGVVENRQRYRRGDVTGQHPSLRIGQCGDSGGPGSDQLRDDALMLLDRPHGD